jgi:hypothetical protein
MTTEERVIIRSNTTKYSHSDMLAWIRELSYYVSIVESYGRYEYSTRDVRFYHVKMVNYASHSASNRMSAGYELEETECTHHHHRCDNVVIKLINPDRLVHDSGMGLLKACLADQRICSLPLMWDFHTLWSRHMGWGNHVDPNLGSLFRSYEERPVTWMITQRFHAAGLGVGTRGDTWDQPRAEAMREEIVSWLANQVDMAWEASARSILGHMANKMEEVHKVCQGLRSGHRINGTMGSRTTENLIMQRLEDFRASMNTLT